jgi:hypothetical protein
MSFQMLKRTRKMRGGDLYAGQLNPAIKAANELATVLQEIARTLPSDTTVAPSVPDSSVPSAASNASNDVASSASNDAASNASNPAPSVIYDKMKNKDRPFFIDGGPFSSESIKKIIANTLALDKKNEKLQKISAVLNAPNSSAEDIVKVLNDNKVHLNTLKPNVFTMSGGTKKRRMRRTKRKTMRRTKRKSMRKTMRKTH